MKRNLWIIGFIITVGIGTIIFEFITTRGTRIVACDVGQGDATLIRSNGYTILIDGGPNSRVLDCLEKHMPFWERKIDMVFLTHPDLDHYGGLIDVLERYKVLTIFEEKLSNNTPEFDAYRSAVQNERAHFSPIYRHAKITLSHGMQFTVLGPDKPFLESESPQGVRTETNPPALIIHMRYGEFDALFSGDSDGEDLVRFVPVGFRPEYMSVPHHGSKNGYTKEAADTFVPRIAVASAGKNNRYGHPAPEVLERLKQLKTKVFNTAQHGSVIVKTDGKRYWIED